MTIDLVNKWYINTVVCRSGWLKKNERWAWPPEDDLVLSGYGLFLFYSPNAMNDRYSSHEMCREEIVDSEVKVWPISCEKVIIMLWLWSLRFLRKESMSKRVWQIESFHLFGRYVRPDWIVPVAWMVTAKDISGLFEEVDGCFWRTSHL